MGITLSQIAANTATVSLTVVGSPINITYYPNKITDQLVAQIESGAIDDNQMLTDLISGWDIFEDDAQTSMLPIARINELGIPIKVQIAEAIVGAMAPKATPQA
jgi:hypothetical protein